MKCHLSPIWLIETALVAIALVAYADAEASDDQKTSDKSDVGVGEIRCFLGHEDTVWAVAASPDGRRLLSSSGDRSVRLWDLETGKELRRLKGHKHWGVFCVAFSPDGRRAVSGCTQKDRSICLWDLDTGKELRRFKDPWGVRSVVFTPDGRTIISGTCNGTLRLWDVETGKELLRLEGHERHSDVVSVAVSPDGRRALSGGSDKTIRLWDLEMGKELRRMDVEEGHVESLAISPDGSRAISGGWDYSTDGNGDVRIVNAVRLWDLTTGKELRRFEGHRGAVYGVAFSPDGRYVVSGSGDFDWGRALPVDCTIRFWDVETGKELHSFEGHTAEVTSVAFSPDGKHLVSASRDFTIRLWRLPGPGVVVQAKRTDEKRAPPQRAEKPWEVVRMGGASIAVPKDWRVVRSPQRQMVLFRQGDGIGVPAVDETKSPLQIGLTVERFPKTTESLKEGIDGLLKATQKNRRLEQIGKESIDSLKLADGNDAMLLGMEFIKDMDRHSLQMKMLVKDKDANGWVISGFIVGGKDSKIPTPDGDLAKWLRAHLESFVFDASKLDEKKLREMYDRREKPAPSNPKP